MLHCYGDTLQHITVNHENRVLQQTKMVQWLWLQAVNNLMPNIGHNPVTLKFRMLSASICEGHRNRNKRDESGLPLETSARTGARGLHGPRRVLRNTDVCSMVHFNIIRTRSHNTYTHAYTNTTTKGLPSVDEQKLLLLPSSTLQRYRSDWLDSNLLVTLPRLALLPAVDAHLCP